MWPAGVGSRLPCPRDSALRRAALSGNVSAISPHYVSTGRTVRVFISCNPDGKDQTGWNGYLVSGGWDKSFGSRCLASLPQAALMV
uniref:Uncharacterized protein n=1 Tax=Erpetoichthys calabaricus TaxID=27687 RepID=A0A8C4X592_ERPCA